MQAEGARRHRGRQGLVGHVQESFPGDGTEDELLEKGEATAHAISWREAAGGSMSSRL